MTSVLEAKTLKLPRSGFQGGFEGSIFQIKILKLYALKAYNKKFKFDLWTEDEEAAYKFDDLLMSYKLNNQTKLIFLQAKSIFLMHGL